MTANDVAKYLDDILDGPLAAPVKYINRVRDRIVELRDRMREVPPGELVTEPPDWLLKALKDEMQTERELYNAEQCIAYLRNRLESQQRWAEMKDRGAQATVRQLHQENAMLRRELESRKT
jgi:hypothetical protein